jgi:hypothetical protein
LVAARATRGGHRARAPRRLDARGVVLLGFGIGIDWLQHAIAPQLRAPNGWAHNQSLDAYLLRLFDPSATMALPHTAPLGQRILSAILTLVILAVTLGEVARLQRPRGHLPVEVGFVVLAILITMRLTWLATLAAMLFVWPALMLVILRDSELGDRARRVSAPSHASGSSCRRRICRSFGVRASSTIHGCCSRERTWAGC